MFDRIVTDPAILGGKPAIHGSRLSVEFVLEWMASGGTIPGFIQAHPHIQAEDVRQALLFAAARVRTEVESVVRVPA